ncbi:(S)-2-hydroxy-acid oxidase, partial [Lecanoromycetidae sp. Uapishka_2]
MAGGAPVPIPDLDPENTILSIADLQKAASKKLGKTAGEFYNSGSTDQITIHENSTAFSRYRLRPRVLVDVSGVDTSTTVFGQHVSFPLSVAPTGLQAMAHPDGELATSRACAKKGVNMTISSYSNNPIETVRSAGTAIGPMCHAIQLYTMKDRSLQERIIRSAEAAGCTAIFLTADSPVLGVRYNEWRNDFRTPEGLAFPIIEKTTEEIRSQTHDSGFVAFNDDSHNWDRDIPWLRSITKMQIWIKGVLTAEDTDLAVKHGCDGIIVSNHGGRQLDGVMATLDALPECVEAAQGRIGVHVDGGLRSGTDIYKALALGADCCWVGRPAIWGLAHDGEAGVSLMLETLHNEFKRCMQLTGCRTVKDITKASLSRRNADGVMKRL